MIKIILTSAILISSTALLSAAPLIAAASYGNLGLYLLGGVALIVTVFAGLTVVKLLDAVVRNRELEIYEKHGLDDFLEAKKRQDPFWKRLYKEATKVVPVSREKEILLDHNYDGIRELDNNLPPWWLAMFYITIVWGVLYVGYYHLSGYGMSSEEAYHAEMAQAAEEVEAFRATQTSLVDETNVEILTGDQDLAEGKQIYDVNCVVCHLDSGGGLVGPNLTDEYWIHGGSIKDIFSTIKYGVPEKGMIAWSSQLKPDAIQKVSSYILTMQGTNPPNAKAPEGDKYVPEGAEPATPTELEEEAATENI